jgi:hypothetical protein
LPPLKRVASSYNLQLVHHWRNLLEAAGLRAVVRNEILSSAMGELPPAECQAEVWVLNEADAARAAAILQGQVSGADWTCTCGEKLGPQFTQCWRCGAYRPAI